jgi:hypothetical protein
LDGRPIIMAEEEALLLLPLLLPAGAKRFTG